MIPALIAGGVALWRGASIAATVAPLVRPALKYGGKLLKGGEKLIRGVSHRPGIGSKVTKGPLMLGKQRLMGPAPARPGIGTALRAGGALAAAAGVGYVSSHRRAARPATQTRPQPARARTPARTSQRTRKCCPAGTKRIVCYKRGRVKPRLGSRASKWTRRKKAKRTYVSAPRRVKSRRAQRRRVRRRRS